MCSAVNVYGPDTDLGLSAVVFPQRLQGGHPDLLSDLRGWKEEDGGGGGGGGGSQRYRVSECNVSTGSVECTDSSPRYEAGETTQALGMGRQGQGSGVDGTLVWMGRGRVGGLAGRWADGRTGGRVAGGWANGWRAGGRTEHADGRAAEPYNNRGVWRVRSLLVGREHISTLSNAPSQGYSDELFNSNRRWA